MSVFSRFAQKFYVPLAGKARQLSTTLVSWLSLKLTHQDWFSFISNYFYSLSEEFLLKMRQMSNQKSLFFESHEDNEFFFHSLPQNI